MNNIIIPLGDDAREDEINEQIAQMFAECDTAIVQARKTLIQKIETMHPDIAKAVLESLPVIKEPATPIIINSGRRATIAEAKMIFGKDFIDPEKVFKIYKKRKSDLLIPIVKDTDELPFTVQFLENMKNMPEGCVLVFQPSMKDGKNLNLDSLPWLATGLSAKPDGILLHKEQFNLEAGCLSKGAWFADTKYQGHNDQQIMRGMWRIATKRPIDGTTCKKFVAQIAIVCNWMEKLYANMVMPNKFAQAIAEFRIKQPYLQKMQDDGVKEFLSVISDILFWNHCMETGLETLYRLVTYNQSTEQKLLVDRYVRNCVTEIVVDYIGESGDSEKSVDGWGMSMKDSRSTWGSLGLPFSCTGEIE